MQSNPHKLTVIDGETLMDKRLPPTKFCVDTLLPQVTLFLLLSQIPSLTSLAFLHRMSDDAFIASFAFVLRPPKWRPQRRRVMPIPLRRRRNFFCLQKEYHDGVCTVISRCRKATFHIPLAEYFTVTERISLYE